MLAFSILVFANLLNFSEVVATFPDLTKPYKFMVDGDKFYVIENQTVSIYSSKDYKLLKKFGRKGEGPMEFIGRLSISGKEEYLIVQGHGKISYWTKMGEFLREVKLTFHFHGDIAQLGKDMYVLNRYKNQTEKDNTDYNAILLYDSGFNEINVIDKKEGKRENLILLFKNKYYFRNSRIKNIIYVIGHAGKKINAYNEKGEKLFIINAPSEKVEISESDKKSAISYYNYKRKGYHPAKPRSHFMFEKHKPEIKNFYEFDNQLYVETWNRKNDKTKFYIFDQNGRLNKKVFLPLVMRNYKDPYPYYVDNGKLYQLVENEDEENWELRVTEVGI